MKLKTTLSLVAIAVLSALIIFGCGGNSSNEAYESFTLFMNKTAGEGQWSAKAHEDKLKDGALVINGLTINLPSVEIAPALQALIDENLGGSEEGEADIAEAPKRTVYIESVVIKKIAAKNEMAKLVAMKDWKEQKPFKLADSIVFKDVKQKTPFQNQVLESSFAEIHLSTVALAAAKNETLTDFTSFLQALTIDKVGYKNLKLTSATPKMEASINEMTLSKLDFSGEKLSFFDQFDKSGLTAIGAAASCQSSSLKDMLLSIEAEGEKQEQISLLISLDSVIKKGVVGPAKADELDLNGLRYEFIINEKDKSSADQMPIIKVGLKSINLKGLDLNKYLEKINSIIEAALISPQMMEKEITKIQNLGDMFVSPLSLKEASLKGFDFSVGEILSLKIAESNLIGPFVSGEICENFKSNLKGMEVIITDDPEKAKGKAQSIYDFAQLFGMNKFFIEGEGEGSYDSQSGVLNRKTSSLRVKDLFEISSELEVGGLTDERVKILKGTPLNMAGLALITGPEAVFGELSLNKFNIKLSDKDLLEKVFNFIAAKMSAKDEKNKINAADVKIYLLDNVKLFLDTEAKQVLDNPEVISVALERFFNEPNELELKLEAKPPLSVKSVMEASGDINAILNSLNIALIPNGNEDTPALLFNIQ